MGDQNDLDQMHQAYVEAKAKVQALSEADREELDKALDVLWEKIKGYGEAAEHKDRVNRVFLALAARYWTCYTVDSRQDESRLDAKQRMDQLVLEVEQRAIATR